MIYGFDTAYTQRDYADDGEHPGQLVNAEISKTILNHMEKV